MQSYRLILHLLMIFQDSKLFFQRQQTNESNESKVCGSSVLTGLPYLPFPLPPCAPPMYGGAKQESASRRDFHPVLHIVKGQCNGQKRGFTARGGLAERAGRDCLSAKIGRMQETIPDAPQASNGTSVERVPRII